MKLNNLRIQGFRKHFDINVQLSNATFLIGENNSGKSSILFAIDYLLSDKKKIPIEEFFHRCNEENCNVICSEKIILTGEFSELPADCQNWRGFKGRVFPYEDGNETKYKIFYRKIFEPGKDYVVELKEFKKNIKEEFKNCSKLQDYIDNGLDNTVGSGACHLS